MGLFDSIYVLIRFLFMTGIKILFLVALILFIPGLPPWGEYTPFVVKNISPLTGPLSLNNRLAKSEILFENRIRGPEAFDDYNGQLYTSAHNAVFRVTEDQLIPVVNFATDKCEGSHTEPECGRPLGLKFDKNGNLYVVETYSGIWKVNINNGQKKLIISKDLEIDGKRSGTPNSLAIASNGDIYWTDSSTDYSLRDGVYALLADGTGRLIHYSASTGQNKVLINKLHFANGVILPDDEEYVLVNDLMRSRIMRYYLKGSKQGQTDVFLDGLPGMPDNLCSDKAGGFLVPLIVGIDENNPSVVQMIGPFPFLRKFLARLVGIFDFVFEKINELYPNYATQFLVHNLGHMEPVSIIAPKRVTIVHVDRNGKILESLHTNDGKISGISDAHVFNNYLYLGSPFNNYIARVKLSDVNLMPPENLRQRPVERQTTQKPTTTTQKPTTTTQKPTTTTQKPTTTTQKPTTTTTQKPTTTTTQKPATTTQRPAQERTETPEASKVTEKLPSGKVVNNENLREEKSGHKIVKKDKVVYEEEMKLRNDEL